MELIIQQEVEGLAARFATKRTTRLVGVQLSKKEAQLVEKALLALIKPAPTPVYCEIVDPSGKVSYRRMSNHPDVQEALRTRGYSVRRAKGGTP